MTDDLALDFRGSYDTSRGHVGAVDLTIGQPMVRFYTRSVLVPFKSEAEARPVHRSATYVHVAFPGERDEIDREATPTDIKRYARHYAAFQEGRMDIMDGMPLSALFPANPEVVDLLKMHKVHTVEQLAEMNDLAIQSVGMGGTEWQAKARRFIGLSKDAARMGAIERRQREQDEAIEREKARSEGLEAQIAELQEQLAKKGGRKLVTEAA